MQQLQGLQQLTHLHLEVSHWLEGGRELLGPGAQPPSCFLSCHSKQQAGIPRHQRCVAVANCLAAHVSCRKLAAQPADPIGE